MRIAPERHLMQIRKNRNGDQHDMKTTKRLWLPALLLAILLIMSFSLCSCDEELPEDPTVTTGAEDETTAVPESTSLDIIKDGKITVVRIVRPSDISDGAPEFTATKRLRETLNNLAEDLKGSDLLFDEKVVVEEDFIMPGQSYDSSTVEILVGATAYDESATAFDGIQYGGYSVKVVGNKILVAAYTSDSYSEAADALGVLIKQSVDNENKSVTLQKADIAFSGNMSARVSAIPTYEGGTFYSYYEAGNDVDEVIIKKTDMTEFNAYLSKLESEGYTCYNTNEVEGNKFTTYNGENYTINAGFYKYESSARITIEELVKKPLPNTPQEYTKVTTSQITLLGLEYANSSESTGYTSNGLSMLIRLEDGRFIVVDGGFNRQVCADKLNELLLEQSKEYATDKKDIKIAAWIITHAHGDHIGMVTNKYGYFRNYTVENFIVNFISDNERARGMAAYKDNWSTSGTEGGGYTSVLAAAKSLKANVHIAHVGEVYYFADAKLEMLFTIESFGPNACNALNTTSLIVKATISGTTLLITGDATGNGFQTAAKTFGTYLKCDILQVAHHGYTTWGNNSGTILAYKYVLPTTLLWPQGGHAYPRYTGKDYNEVLLNTQSNPNYAETYVAGFQGDTVTLPLPYTVGTAVVNRTSSSNIEGGNKVISGK